MSGRIDRVQDRIDQVSIPRAEVTALKEAADLTHARMQHDIDTLANRIDTLIVQQYALIRELKEKNGNHK